MILELLRTASVPRVFLKETRQYRSYPRLSSVLPPKQNVLQALPRSSTIPQVVFDSGESLRRAIMMG
ncbi:hypothetical protein BD310DRAFT_162860 [Dichomitus squalens]|uniref:Uncharacterized protein n=1 Tax=Dichomitus squalens TaxID=114155 RepID=A0A4Q9PEF5_9APHY|nr:hypothetical protein BD310DRAFT_162860 [Dichomitus squalens]